jgi:hypothetical protein
MNKTATPTKTLLQGCDYTPAAATDVTKTWRKFGWMPKHELDAQAQAKAALTAAKGRSHVRNGS